MTSEQENKWKRDLYKTRNSPSPTFGTAVFDPPDDPPDNRSSEDEWKRQLYQNKLAAQNTLASGDPPPDDSPEETEAPSLPAPPFLTPPTEKEGANPAADAEKNLTEKIRMGTAEALRLSWLNLIDTIFLTYLYIIFHYIMAYLGGPLARFFPRAGREWIMKNLRKTPQPKKTKEWSIETTGALIEPFELLVFFLIAGLILAQILLYLFFFYLITHPCEALKLFAKVSEIANFLRWVARVVFNILCPS